MGKSSALSTETLLFRAERVRTRAFELRDQFIALRELRQLEDDLTSITATLARTIAPFGVAHVASRGARLRLLAEAEAIVSE
jgi:hypothetical protein